MSNHDHDVDRPLRDEMTAALERLARARRTLGGDKALELNEVGVYLQAVAERVASLSSVERRQMQPLLLALLDEVERTIEVFEEALAGMRRDLTSAHQGRAAGAAYRQRRKL